MKNTLQTPKKFVKHGIVFTTEIGELKHANFYFKGFLVGYASGAFIFLAIHKDGKKVMHQLNTPFNRNFGQAVKYFLENTYDIFCNNDLHCKHECEENGVIWQCGDECIIEEL